MILARFGAAIGLALAGLQGSALMAQDPAPFRVEFDKFAILAGGGPVGEERTVVPRDEVLRTNVGYSSAARLAAPLSLTIAGLPLNLPAGELMLEGAPRGETRDRLGRDARTFCGPPMESLPRPAHGEPRYRDPTFLCLVDANGDQRFEAAFLVGTRRAPDIVIMNIPATPYVGESNLPLPGSTAWVTFEQGAALQGPVLELHVNMFGRPAYIRGVNIVTQGRRQFFPIERTVRRSVYPHTIAFGDAQIAILDYVPEGRHLRLRVDQPFATAVMQLEAMGPNIMFIYR